MEKRWEGRLYNEILVVVLLVAFLLCHVADSSLSKSRFIFHGDT